MKKSQETNLARVLCNDQLKKLLIIFAGVLKTGPGFCGFFHHNVSQVTSAMYQYFMLKAFILHKQKRGLKSSEKNNLWLFLSFCIKTNILTRKITASAKL